MVAIQAALALAMAIMVTAAPSGSVNTNLRFFRIDDSVCDKQPGGGVQIDQVSIFNPPLTAGQLGINTCIPHSAWGSVAIDNIQSGCVFQEFSDSACAVPVRSGTAGGQCVQGLGLDAFYKVSCT